MSKKFYTLMLFRQADHLYKSEIKEVLIQILCGTPEWIFSIQMFDHLKQLFVHVFEQRKEFTLTPYDFNLKMRPSCQTLSNTLEMSRKAPLNQQ